MIEIKVNQVKNIKKRTLTFIERLTFKITTEIEVTKNKRNLLPFQSKFFLYLNFFLQKKCLI